MRGEHNLPYIRLILDDGSSPHARGTLGGRLEHGVHDGIIPACAGNTGTEGGCAGIEWDHPRMRGEHLSLLLV